MMMMMMIMMMMMMMMHKVSICFRAMASLSHSSV